MYPLQFVHHRKESFDLCLLSCIFVYLAVANVKTNVRGYSTIQPCT